MPASLAEMAVHSSNQTWPPDSSNSPLKKVTLPVVEEWWTAMREEGNDELLGFGFTDFYKERRKSSGKRETRRQSGGGFYGV